MRDKLPLIQMMTLLTRLHVAYVLLTRLYVARLFRGGGRRAVGDHVARPFRGGGQQELCGESGAVEVEASRGHLRPGSRAFGKSLRRVEGG